MWEPLKTLWSNFNKDIDRKLPVLNGLMMSLSSHQEATTTNYSFGVLADKKPPFISLALTELQWRRLTGAHISAVYLHQVVELQTAASNSGTPFKALRFNQSTPKRKWVTLCSVRHLMSWSVLTATVKTQFVFGNAPQCSKSKSWRVTTLVCSTWQCHLTGRELSRGLATKHCASGTFSRSKSKTRREYPKSTWLHSRLDESILLIQESMEQIDSDSFQSNCFA